MSDYLNLMTQAKPSSEWPVDASAKTQGIAGLDLEASNEQVKKAAAKAQETFGEQNQVEANQESDDLLAAFLERDYRRLFQDDNSENSEQTKAGLLVHHTIIRIGDQELEWLTFGSGDHETRIFISGENQDSISDDSQDSDESSDEDCVIM